MSNNVLSKIFKLITENKMFPAYQAERRIDIFINIFLERILTEYLKEKTTYLCPEFPLKSENNNRSTRLDYLCKTATQPVFVELKTDADSLRDNQALKYLDCTWKKCLEDIAAIKAGSNYKDAYNLLMDKLNKNKFNDDNPIIRTIFITPINYKTPLNPFKKIAIKEMISIQNLKISVSEEELVVWNFILGLDLYVFEITK